MKMTIILMKKTAENSSQKYDKCAKNHLENALPQPRNRQKGQGYGAISSHLYSGAYT